MLAVTTPLSIALMVLAEPILEVWLGERFIPAATATTIFVSYWLFAPCGTVGSSMLWAAGRTRVQVGIAWATAAINLVLSLALTAWLGLEGVVLGTTIAYALLLPVTLHYVTDTFPVTIGELARRAFLPAFAPGVFLAAVLVAANALLDLSDRRCWSPAGAARSPPTGSPTTSSSCRRTSGRCCAPGYRGVSRNAWNSAPRRRRRLWSKPWPANSAEYSRRL